MRRVGWQDRARYAFDNLMAKGTPALVGLLGLASAPLGSWSSPRWPRSSPPGDTRDNGNWPGAVRALLRTMDPGTMGSDEGSPVYLLLRFVVTLGGIFLLSA